MNSEILQFTVLGVINIVAILLGVWVFKSAIKERLNQLFLFISFLIILWVNFSFLGSFMKSKSLSVFFYRLNTGSVCLFLFVFYYFFLYFVKRKKKNFFLTYFIFVCSLFLTITSVFTNLIIKNVSIHNNSSELIFGSLNNFLSIFAAFVSIVIFYYGFKAYSLLPTKEKQRIKYFLLGITAFIIANIIFNIIFPQFFNTTKFQQLGDFSFIFFLGFTAYAIVKHRLMDIRLIVARSVVYSLLITIFAGFYAGAIFATQTFIFPEATYSTGYVVLQVALALIIAFTFQPLRNLLTKVTDKIFFKQKYNAQELLDTLSHTMSGTIILIELLYKTLDILLKEMRLTHGIFILLSDYKIYQTQSNGYKAVPNLDIKQLKKLTEKDIIVYDELEEGNKLKSILRKAKAEVVVTLKTETQLIGLLFVGEKSSGDMFNNEDIQVLNILAPQIAVAVQNAKSYEEIQRFNVTLRAEVQRQTRKLQEANEHLKELDKAKDEFLSMASHQLRTPLTAIKGYLSMLLEGDAGEVKIAQFDFVNEAFQGANRMVGLINDLLNVSRMDTGKFFLEPTPIKLDAIVNDEIRQLEPHARDKHLYLKKEVEGKIPTIEADETKLRQVIMNFIDNAVYYTKEGGITVKISKDADNMKLEVIDTGIGVPDKQKKNLFSKFYRADNARKIRPDGTGLGLYLAKRVVDDHGGELIFNSEEGKGSTFGFKLPIKTKLSHAEQMASMQPIARIKSKSSDKNEDKEKKSSSTLSAEKQNEASDDKGEKENKETGVKK